MRLVRIPRVSALFSVNTSDIALVRAQLVTFNKQVPLLYFTLCVNVVLCAIGIAGAVPRPIGVYMLAAVGRARQALHNCRFGSI